MATTTLNYGFIKPDSNDDVDITALNENFDNIDKQLKIAKEALPPVATKTVAGIVKPDGTTITVDPDGTIHGAQTYQLPMASGNTLGGIKIGKNLTMQEDGTLNAYASLETDSVPTKGSSNVPTSGGTFTMIDSVDKKVDSVTESVKVLSTGLKWKNAVDTFSAIATTYPTPEEGWTVMCLDTGYAYQWNGENWIIVYLALAPVASSDDIEAVLEV